MLLTSFKCYHLISVLKNKYDFKYALLFYSLFFYIIYFHLSYSYIIGVCENPYCCGLKYMFCSNMSCKYNILQLLFQNTRINDIISTKQVIRLDKKRPHSMEKFNLKNIQYKMQSVSVSCETPITNKTIILYRYIIIYNS